MDLEKQPLLQTNDNYQQPRDVAVQIESTGKKLLLFDMHMF